jgi:hypothetical protein
MKRLSLGIVLATAATVGLARTLPPVDLVHQYLQNGRYKEVLAACKTRRLIAPAANAGKDLECWAANAANDLEKEPDSVTALVVNGSALDAALTRCKALSMEQRFKSQECAAAGRADTFISLRLPRTVETLKPLKFK